MIRWLWMKCRVWRELRRLNNTTALSAYDKDRMLWRVAEPMKVGERSSEG